MVNLEMGETENGENLRAATKAMANRALNVSFHQVSGFSSRRFVFQVLTHMPWPDILAAGFSSINHP
jgi:hypothetical protein